MLIGIDASRALRTPRTGTENYSLYLIRALVAQGEDDRFVLYSDREPPDGLVQGDRVTWRVLPARRLWTHWRLAWEVTSRPPDVLFVPAHVLPWLRRCPAVATVHDLGYLYYPQAHPPLQRLYLRLGTRWNCFSAQRVLADSMATQEDILSHKLCQQTKVVVAYPAGTPGLHPVREPAALRAVRRRYGTGERYWLSLGTLQPRKNLETLIGAFASLARDTLPADMRLVLAGNPGWYYDRVMAAVQRVGLGDRIVLPGFVLESDVPALLSGAFAFVLPSWYEGFGLPVQEAMACGTPVICSRVSSLPEVAGDAALLFDPADQGQLEEAMRRLWQDTLLYQDLSRRGQEQARRFTWEACARQTMLALRAAANRGGA
ncbi:MAG: glycosyltransferase family 4 protein [Anaerolineae bacterium]|jgi:glycosyltransferase involved in cell wall biosynthesis|nr:glycosyltransferase family 4 protein [Chloroflexota bacterium]